MRLRARLILTHGPSPVRGTVSSGEVSIMGDASPERFFEAMSASLPGAERGEEKHGAFRGPTWAWSSADDTLLVDGFVDLDLDDTTSWGEVALEVDCDPDVFMAWWQRLLAQGMAAWIYWEGELIAPDAFEDVARKEGWIR